MKNIRWPTGKVGWQAGLGGILVMLLSMKRKKTSNLSMIYSGNELSIYFEFNGL